MASGNSSDLQTLNKMRNSFWYLGFGTLFIAIVTAGFGAIFFNNGTPPIEGEAYRQWLINHQEQFMKQEADQFYWTEIHSGILLWVIAAVSFFSSLYLFQLLMVVKISEITARAVR